MVTRLEKDDGSSSLLEVDVMAMILHPCFGSNKHQHHLLQQRIYMADLVVVVVVVVDPMGLGTSFQICASLSCDGWSFQL